MRQSANHPSSFLTPRIPILMLGLLCISHSPAHSAEENKPVERTLNWLQDYGEALKSAVTSKRPVWLQFTGPWCPNCHKMDKETFKHPRVIDEITKLFVPAKISCDENADLALSFGFTQLPATVLISTDGKVLAKHEGFADVETLKKLTASAGITIDTDLPKPVTDQLLAKETKPATIGADLVAKPKVSDRAPIEIAMVDPNQNGLKLTPPKDDSAPAQDAQELDTLKPPNDLPKNPSPKPVEPLGFYCPVTLLERAVLIETDSKHTAVYAGRRYFFADAEARQRFAESPEKFVPVRGGECLVTLVENRQEVQGSKDFPLVYDNKIFLCATEDQRERFLNDPATYAVEDIRRPGVCPHCKAPMNRQTADKGRFQIRFGGSRYQFPDRSHMEAFLLSPLKYLR